MSSERWSGRRIEARAQDICAALARIREYIAGFDRDEFATDRKTRSAVERELLTISEACGKIQDLERAQEIPAKRRIGTRFPDTPWAEIRGLGNILRHEYGRVDAEIVWLTITGSDLKKLERALVAAFPDLGD